MGHCPALDNRQIPSNHYRLVAGIGFFQFLRSLVLVTAKNSGCFISYLSVFLNLILISYHLLLAVNLHLKFIHNIQYP